MAYLCESMTTFPHTVSYNLNWLPISHQIKFRSIHAVLRYYRQDIGCLLLDPPIQFGRQHSYQTRCRENFASVAMCRLTSIMRHFHFAASTWWNSLPMHINRDTTFQPLPLSVINRVKIYVFFVGVARSGHSIVGAILDSHPHIVIS